MKGVELCDCDFGVEVDILDGVDELDSFAHRALEGFASADETHASGSLVDYGGEDGIRKVGVTV